MVWRSVTPTTAVKPLSKDTFIIDKIIKKTRPVITNCLHTFGKGQF